MVTHPEGTFALLWRLPRPTLLHTTAVSAGSVTLRWRDNSNGESHMEVQRRLSGAIKWMTIGVLPENTRDYVDNGVDPGENYEYQVRARGHLNECIGHSRFSAVLAVSTPVP